MVDGSSLEICFQEIGFPPMAKRPMRLDIATPDRQTETARLVSLGASIVQELRTRVDVRSRNNEFCLTDS